MGLKGYVVVVVVIVVVVVVVVVVVKYLDGILQNLYLQWRKQSVLHGKMDGRLSLLMVAGQLSLSIPYWSLGMVQKY